MMHILNAKTSNFKGTECGLRPDSLSITDEVPVQSSSSKKGYPVEPDSGKHLVSSEKKRCDWGPGGGPAAEVRIGFQLPSTHTKPGVAVRAVIPVLGRWRQKAS